MKALIKHWRSLGIRIFAFVNDIFGGSHSYQDTKRISAIVKNDLMKSGFLANELKSFWEPCQVGEHLGLTVDSKEGTLSVTPANSEIQSFACLSYEDRVSYC